MKKALTLIFLGLLQSHSAFADCSVGALEHSYRFDSTLYRDLKSLLQTKGISIEHVSTYPLINIKENRTSILVEDESGIARSYIKPKDLYLDRNYSVISETSRKTTYDVTLTLYSNAFQELAQVDAVATAREVKQRQDPYQRQAGERASIGERIYRVSEGMRNVLIGRTGFEVNSERLHRLADQIESQCSKP